MSTWHVMPWQLSLLFRLAVYNLCESNGFWGNIYVADFCELSYAQAVTHHLCPVWCIYVCMCPVLVTLVFVNLSPVHSLSVPVNVLCSVYSTDVFMHVRVYSTYVRTYTSTVDAWPIALVSCLDYGIQVRVTVLNCIHCTTVRQSLPVNSDTVTV